MLRIAHFSDLHFGEDHKWASGALPNLENAIINSLKNNEDYRPDIIVICGDITSFGSEREYEQAYNFLNNLLCDKIFDTLLDIVMVPGNHDFKWYDEKKAEIYDMTIREKEYRNFYNKVKSSIREKLWSENGLNKEPLPEDIRTRQNEHLIDLTCIPRHEEDVCYLFAGLNSVKIDGPSDRGIGFFTSEQLDTFTEIVTFYKDYYHGLEVQVIPFYHHHLLPVAYVEHGYIESMEGKPRKQCSITVDSRMVLNKLIEGGSRFSFSGHQHQPDIVKFSEINGKGNKEITVVSAGSIGAVRSVLGEIAKNQFFLHEVTKDSLSIRSFITGERYEGLFQNSEEFCGSIFWNRNDCARALVMPKRLVMKDVSTRKDESNLFFSFLNVKDCKMAREKIEQIARHKFKKEIELCGMYDLYGRFDTMIKYREKRDGFAKKFHKCICDELKTIFMVRQIPEKFLDVYVESYNLNDLKLRKTNNCRVMMLPNEDTEEGRYWTTAVIEVILEGKMIEQDFVDQFHQNIFNSKDEESIQIEKIIRAIHITMANSVVFELNMSCNQLYYLNKLSRILENIIDSKGIDKYTHIAYTRQELI